MSITIRQATPDDATAIYDMIYELAVYEKAPEEVVTTPEEIRETLFASGSKTEALICEVAGKARCFSPATPPGLDAMVSIWRICTSPPTIAGSAPEKRC